MSIFLIVGVWSTLTLLFMFRLRNIMINLGRCLTPGDGLLRVPAVSLKPIRQLIIWIAELLMLVLWYDVFGISICAHLVASICAAGLMILLRDKRAPSLLHSVQLIPDHEESPSLTSLLKRLGPAVAAS